MEYMLSVNSRTTKYEIIGGVTVVTEDQGKVRNPSFVFVFTFIVVSFFLSEGCLDNCEFSIIL